MRASNTQNFALIFGLILFAWAPPANAKDLCETYRNYVPLPDWYAEYCSSGRSRVAGAFSSFVDAFNLNPATIPTFNLPAGVEFISSRGRQRSTGELSGKSNLAVLKGYRRFGLGVSTESESTVYSNYPIDTVDHVPINNFFHSVTGVGSVASSVNGGVALDLSPSGSRGSFLWPQIGFNARYNQRTKRFGAGVGAAMSSRWLSLGASFVSDRGIQNITDISYYTWSIGVKLRSLQLEYLNIQDRGGRAPTTILSSSVKVFFAYFTLALRNFENELGSRDGVMHLGLQVPISRHVTLGYFINYVPGYASLMLQVFL